MAGRIVEKANVRQPADLLLRQTLARRRGLTPDQASWISRAVFAYFRWQQWLDAARPIEDRLQQAITLADRFAKEADWPNPAELASHAVPAWTASAMPVDPAWLRSLQSEAPLWLRVAPGALEVVQEELGADGALSAGPLPDSLRYAGREDLFLSHAFQDGLIEIQDLASQAVGHVCAPQPGETWWDACAGEGGKTLHLSALMKGQGLIWASDRADWRLDRLKQRAARAHCFNHRRVAWDGGAKPPTRTVFDGVLVDAPCSGIGTWARNPHARWTTTPEDTQELAAIQRSLLDNVVSSVKPGGRLVYAVCTLSTAETVDVAKAFSEKHPEFEPCPFPNPVDPSAAPAAELTLWPQATSGNGMFIAAWRRKPVKEAEPPATPAA